MPQIKIQLENVDQLQLLGSHDEFLRLIEASFAAKIVVRGNEISISGDQNEIEAVKKLFYELVFLIQRNGKIHLEDVKTVINLVQVNEGLTPEDSEKKPVDTIVFSGKKADIRVRSNGQKEYVQAAKDNDICFVIGPAGTGKTFLAVALALSALEKKEVSRIILSRPAIEAGENLGYLPGDVMEKVDPYLRPLTDALFSMLPSDHLQRLVERKIIEVVPLAYMRGRTLNHAFVILDEAQNTSPMQMKMFLTRLGVNSKTIITGDVTQIDLADKTKSGLIQIQEILIGIDGITFVYLDRTDVVRHPLVRKIILAYEHYQNHSPEKGPEE